MIKTRVHGHRLVETINVGKRRPFTVRVNGNTLNPLDIRHLSLEVIQIIGGHRGRVELFEDTTCTIWEPEDAGTVLAEACDVEGRT